MLTLVLILCAVATVAMLRAMARGSEERAVAAGVAATALVILASVLAGCNVSQVTGPTTVIVQQPTPSAVPSGLPGPNGLQKVFGAKVSEFGEAGCANPAEANPRETRVGCNSAVTCSPTDSNGTVIKDEEGNPNPSYVQLVSFKQLGGTGAGKFSQDDNAFNGHVVCTNTGVVVLECSLKDKASGKVVTGGDGGNHESPWSMSCVP